MTHLFFIVCSGPKIVPDGASGDPGCWEGPAGRVLLPGGPSWQFAGFIVIAF